MSKSIEELGLDSFSERELWLWEQVSELAKRMEALEGHVHVVPDTVSGQFTEPPLVDGVNNEGQEIWKPIQ